MPRKTSVLALIISATFTHAQTTVNINDGQTLTEADLLAGAFNGQPFTLAPTTTFEVNSGGAIGPVGDFGPVPTGPFGFEGSIINLNAGAQLISNPAATTNFDASFVYNTEINIFSGANIGNNFNTAEGTRVNVQGGTIGDFPIIHDSHIIINDGAIGDVLDATNTNIQLINGVIGDRLKARDGTTVHISGGVVDGDVMLLPGAAFDITGGSVTGAIDLQAASSAQVNGGSINWLIAEADADVVVNAGDICVLRPGRSTVTINGGRFGSTFFAPDTNAVLRGSEFRLNNIPTDDLPSGLPRGSQDIFTCTLADGTPLIWYAEKDRIDADVTLIETAVPEATSDPITVDSDIAPTGLREGQLLTLTEGGTLPNQFDVVSATLNITGGSAGDVVTTYSDITVSGGSVNMMTFIDSTAVIDGRVLDIDASTSTIILEGGETESIYVRRESDLTVRGGTHEYIWVPDPSPVTIEDGRIGRLALPTESAVQITGGNVECFGGGETVIHVNGGDVGVLSPDSSEIYGGTVNLNGGRLGALDLLEQGTINIAGGHVVGRLRALQGTTVNISGGQIDGFSVSSSIAFFVLDVTLDGRRIPLQVGETTTINERNGELMEMTLADGTPLTIDLDCPVSYDQYCIRDTTIVTVTRTAPCPCELGGNPSTIDITDLLTYLDLWFAQDPQADIDDDTIINIADLLAFLDCWLPASLGSGCG